MAKIWSKFVDGVIYVWAIFMLLIISLGAFSNIRSGNWQQPLFFFLLLLSSVAFIYYRTRHRRWFARCVKVYTNSSKSEIFKCKTNFGSYDADTETYINYVFSTRTLEIGLIDYWRSPQESRQQCARRMEEMKQRMEALSPHTHFIYKVDETMNVMYTAIIPRKEVTPTLLKQIKKLTVECNEKQYRGSYFTHTHDHEEQADLYAETSWERCREIGIYADGRKIKHTYTPSAEGGWTDENGVEHPSYIILDEEEILENELITPEEFERVWHSVAES